jgi:hypothetical protein
MELTGGCPCGSVRYTAEALHAGTLDQPGQFAPTSHYGVEGRLGWVDCGTGLPEKATAERW